jgi:hypothetical protein
MWAESEKIKPRYGAGAGRVLVTRFFMRDKTKSAKTSLYATDGRQVFSRRLKVRGFAP